LVSGLTEKTVLHTTGSAFTLSPEMNYFSIIHTARTPAKRAVLFLLPGTYLSQSVTSNDNNYETIPNPSRPGPPNIHGPNPGGAHVRLNYNRNLYNNKPMKRIDHATTTAEIIKTLDHVHTDADGYSYLLNHLLELKSCYWLISQMDQRKDELLKHSQNSADPKLKEYFLGQHDALNSFLGHFETLVKTQP
jgi:hypothetical protein